MTRSTARSRLLALALIVALVVACGAEPPSGSATPVPSGVVSVTASEFKYDPATLSVGAGAVSFAVHNGGNIEHQFEIFKADQKVAGIEGLAPGQSKDLTVTLEPGQYTYVCKLAGHEEQGMKGTLTVTGG